MASIDYQVILIKSWTVCKIKYQYLIVYVIEQRLFLANCNLMMFSHETSFGCGSEGFTRLKVVSDTSLISDNEMSFQGKKERSLKIKTDEIIFGFPLNFLDSKQPNLISIGLVNLSN